MYFSRKKDVADGMDYRKNLIKVPACPEHNSHKSKDDEYLLYVLAAYFSSNDIGLNQFMSKVQRAMIRKPRLAITLGASAEPVDIHDTESGLWHEAFALRINNDRINLVIDHCAGALYFHHKNEKVLGNVKVLSAFFLIPDQVALNEANANAFDLVERTIADEPFFGEHQAVFYYKFVSECSSSIIYMKFYGASKFVAFLSNP